jgi:hypothetical protein
LIGSTKPYIFDPVDKGVTDSLASLDKSFFTVLGAEVEHANIAASSILPSTVTFPGFSTEISFL